MKTPLILAAIAAFSSICLRAQQPSESTPAPAPVAAQASTSILQDGIPLKLRLVNKLDSRVAKDRDQIAFEVVNDVVLGGVTVLRRGAEATGIVTDAKASRNMGRAGRLSFMINDIKLRNGTTVPVRAFNRSKGENRSGEIVQLMVSMPIAAAPFFLLIHGTNGTFERGTEINAFVNGDVRLDLATFDGAPSGDHVK
jgi:hypothetical protein